MTEPCANTERFTKLESAVQTIKESSASGAKAQERAADEMTVLSREVRTFMTRMLEKSAEAGEKISNLKEGHDILFQFKRRLEDRRLPEIEESIRRVSAANVTLVNDVLEKRVMPIEIKHLKEQGAAAAFKDIKVLVPSLLATGLAIISLWEKVVPWLTKILQ